MARRDSANPNSTLSATNRSSQFPIRKPVYLTKSQRSRYTEDGVRLDGNELDAYEELAREREQDRMDYEDYKNSPDYDYDRDR